MDLAERKYPIMTGRGLLSEAGKLLLESGFKTAPIVVSNARIWKLHGAVLEKSLNKAFGPIRLILIGDGERFKDHSTLLKIYRAMFRAHADRRSWILAFGGGVIGDIAGFAAATFMRGIRYVIVPTTMLAQVDSSIGGKVAINVKEGKNLIGAFHQPTAVLTDVAVLKTLPKRELASGLYEVIKSAAIRSELLLSYLERKLPEILSCRLRETEEIVLNTAKIKANVVASDEKREWNAYDPELWTHGRPCSRGGNGLQEIQTWRGGWLGDDCSSRVRQGTGFASTRGNCKVDPAVLARGPPPLVEGDNY